MMCVNVFYTTRNEIPAESDKRQRFPPWTPIIKIAHFCNVMSIDMTLQKRAIFIMGGQWGNFSFFVGSSWNFVPGYIKRRWHTSWKFQFEKTSNKKVTAKKPLTNLYEMNSMHKVYECMLIPRKYEARMKNLYIPKDKYCNIRQFHLWGNGRRFIQYIWFAKNIFAYTHVL